MILAAGLGERMRPLTFGRAKSSLPLFNKPFIFHAIEYLKRFGIQDIVINLHHKPDSIKSILDVGSHFSTKIRYSYESEILGTAGGIKKLEDFFSAETFVLMNSDFVSDISLNKAIEYHKKEKPLATLVLQKSETKEYSKVKVGADNRIKAIGVQDGKHIFCGLHIVEPDIFHDIPAEKNLDINRDIYSSLILKGVTLKAYEHNGFWFEFGNLKRYFHGHMELAKRGPGFIKQILNVHFADHVHPSDPDRKTKLHSSVSIFSNKNLRIDHHSTVQGIFIAGEECHLEKDVTIEDSILHDNVILSSGAELSRCIVGENVKIPEGMKLYGSAIALMPDEKITYKKEGEFTKKGNLLIKRFLD